MYLLLSSVISKSKGYSKLEYSIKNTGISKEFVN